ncbi:MAG: S1 RNA-binding domain-containing protein [Myxococcales bacterium]|nr:S1 RNA-binding domain-containing protein [Myxococcales bacterium]
MSDLQRRPSRRRGPRDTAEEAAPAAPETPRSPAVVRAAPAAPAPAAVAPPPDRAPTDFDGLRVVAGMDRADVAALMEEFGGARRTTGLRVGQRVRGPVTSVGQQAVFVDVGGKADAALDRMELGEVVLGEMVDAFVLSTEGEVRLTRTPSGGAAREMLAEAMSAKMPVVGRISSVSDAGWQVALADGIAAFCPGSHTSVNETGAAEHVGQSLPFLIHDIRGRDVVVSRRVLVEEEERARQSERYGALQVNEVVEGTVTKLADFGAFVALPNGIEGLVHISNLADRRLKHPSEVVKEGDVVTVRVLAIDRPRRRVELSVRAAGSPPGAPPPGVDGGAPLRQGFDLFAALLKDVKVKRK